jgi:hypothetical protein
MLQDMGPFRRRTLERYISQMSTPNPKGIFDGHVAEILEQQGFRWEEDPRSIYDPQQLYTALERYATEWDDYEYMDEYLRRGFERAYKIFSKPKGHEFLPILTDDEVVSKALKLGKSSGLPMMTSKSESLTYSFDRELQIRLERKAPNPCVAFKRTQKGNKTRLVWGYPLEMTIMESRFARPFINEMLQRRTPMAFGMTKCELGAYIHRYIIESGGRIVAMDYSRYDTTLSRTMIRAAFRIIATWFDKTDLGQYGWDKIIHYFIHTPIVMPDGHLYRGKHHGVPSGSYFTQVVDSICNVALCYALSERFGFSLSKRSLFVLGDDVLMSVVGDVDLNKWADYLGKFGLKLNVDKTLLDRVHFLGAFWDKGKPDVPIQEIVNKAVFPEHYRDYGGQPHKGANAVVRSYASNYLSAIRFLPLNFADMRRVDFGDMLDVNPNHLSGSDKFLLEEGMLNRTRLRKAYYPTLSVRILL